MSIRGAEAVLVLAPVVLLSPHVSCTSVRLRGEKVALKVNLAHTRRVAEIS